MNDAFAKALDRAIAVANAHERELLAYPGVLAVGAGPERRGGRLTGAAAIVVTVRSKTSRDALERVLPEALDGVPVDVIEQGKPVEAPEIVAAQARARLVLERVRDTWLAAPGVTGIGIGYRTSRGETKFNQVTLKLFVQQKLPPEELRRRNITPVPREIDGVATDIEVLGLLRPSGGASGSRADRKDPLVGGIALGVNTKPFYFGTLGAIVRDRASGELLVLSNQHVLDAPVGTEVVQPSPITLDDSLDIGFQLDFCNPLHFFRLDTPNTTLGSILAGAAVTAALAAALSDEIDPTRRGQEALPPPPGARTLLERQKVRLTYSGLPIPGTHFKIGSAWEYTRQTDVGEQSLSVDEVKVNPHVLVDKLLLTDRALYHPGDTIRLLALILPEPCMPGQADPRDAGPVTEDEVRTLTAIPDLTPPSLAAGITRSARAAASASVGRCACERYHVTALLTPTTVDRAFPVVLREPVSAQKSSVVLELLELVRERDDPAFTARISRFLRRGCLYSGKLPVGNLPTGPWKKHLFVQTVNTATEQMKPTQAAQIIGGLPVSRNSRPQIDASCGPVVEDDGEFDIELI